MACNFFSKREFLASMTWSNFARSLGKGMFDCSSWQVFGILCTVLVLDPPKLVCRVLFVSYKWGLKDFHFDELKFYSLFWVSSAIWDHFLTKYSKVGSKIKVHQNENLSNPISQLVQSNMPFYCLYPAAPNLEFHHHLASRTICQKDFNFWWLWFPTYFEAFCPKMAEMTK